MTVRLGPDEYSPAAEMRVVESCSQKLLQELVGLRIENIIVAIGKTTIPI